MKQSGWNHDNSMQHLVMTKTENASANVYEIEILMYAGDAFQICYGGTYDGQVGIGYVPGVEYADGVKSYILAPEGLKPGMKVMNGPKAEASVGNCLPLIQIPLGLMVHAIELVPGQGAKIGRSAGNACQVMARSNGTVTLKMPSGEVRIFNGRCLACIGTVGNKDWDSISLGKAGRKRHMGIRPTVRGVAMNPVDHPMGGGEGRTSGGSHPRSPWGQLAKGGKTRAKRKASDKVIVKRRK